MKQIQTVTPILTSLQAFLQKLTCLALAILLFAGLNCATTNPVNEEGRVETTTTEAAVQPTPASETSEPELEAAQLQEEQPALEPAPQPAEEEVEEVAEKLEPGEGLSLGSQAPAFELPDGEGKLHALNDYIGDQKVVLVFYRGGW